MNQETPIRLECKNDTPSFICQLRKYHFAQVAHSWPDARIRLLYEQWRQFFTSETKSAYRSSPGMLEGYFPMESERAKTAHVPDPKEFFHFYTSGICPSHLRDETNELFKSLEAISKQLLSLLDHAISEEGITPPLPNLIQMIQDSPAIVLRIAHYPPVPSTSHDLAASHEDINLLTLLPPATEPGLEIESPSGDWIPVRPQSGVITVLAGEMLALATDNRIKASTHRVISPHPRLQSSGRMSFNFFVNPKGTTMLTPSQSAAEILAKRLSEIGYMSTSNTSSKASE